MSIAKRVAEAVNKMVQHDAEGALLPISSAVDATATKHFGCRGRKSYKDFIHEYLGLITKTALGAPMMNLRLRYDHPDLEKNADGVSTIQDILYHVVRCGLAHSAEIPSTLRFVDEKLLSVEDDILVLPSAIIYGLIIAVVVCPANTDQSIDENYVVDVGGTQVRLNDLWGRKADLERLLAATDAEQENGQENGQENVSG